MILVDKYELLHKCGCSIGCYLSSNFNVLLTRKNQQNWTNDIRILRKRNMKELNLSTFMLFCVVIIVWKSNYSSEFKVHEIVKRSSFRYGCPLFLSQDKNFTFDQLAGEWITLNATVGFLECYKLRIRVYNTTTALLATAVDIGDGRIYRALAICKIMNRSKCIFPKEDDEDDDVEDYENTFHVVKADPKKYMVTNLCIKYRSGRKVDRWTEIYSRRGVTLDDDDMEEIEEFLGRSGIDYDSMYQIHSENCTYNF